MRDAKTDGNARPCRKGDTASELRHIGHPLSNNRHGLILSTMVATAHGFAEREA